MYVPRHRRPCLVMRTDRNSQEMQSRSKFSLQLSCRCQGLLPLVQSENYTVRREGVGGSSMWPSGGTAIDRICVVPLINVHSGSIC